MDDPRGRKNPVYHSSSPDELKARMENQKQQNRKQSRPRRIALLLVFLNLLIISVIFTVFLFLKGKAQPFEHIRNVSPFVFRIVSAEEYVYGEVPEITIKLSNSSASVQQCEIEKFEFYIRWKSRDGENVFSFLFPLKNTVMLDRYDSRSVYEFKRDNPSFTLDPGSYYIVCKFIVKGNPIELANPLVISEEISSTFFLRDDFWIPSQEYEPFLRLKNNSPKSQNYKFGIYSIKIMKDSKILQSVSMQIPQAEVYLGAGESLDIPLQTVQAPEMADSYTFSWSFFVNNLLKEGKREVLVQSISEKQFVEKIRLISYSLKVIGQSQPYQAELLIANDNDTPVYLELKKFRFYILQNRNELYRYESDRIINVMIPAFSTRTVFRSEEWKMITFQTVGEYLVKVSAELQHLVVDFEEKLSVLERIPNP